MSTTMHTARFNALLTAVSIFALASMTVPSMTVPSQAGGLGGVVGGAVGAIGGAVGGVAGGLSGSDGSGGLTGSDGTSGHTGNASTSSGSHSVGKGSVLSARVGLETKKGVKVKLKLKALGHKGLKAKANAHLLNGHGKVAKVKAFANLGGAKGLNAKARAKVLDGHGNIIGAKAKITLGTLKAKAGVRAGLDGVGVHISLGLGGHRKSGGGDNGNGGGGNGGGNNGGVNPGVGSEIAALSSGERLQLRKKCPTVLANPAAYSRDAVSVCRVIAQLAGL